MARWHAEAHDVDEAAGPPVGDRAKQGGGLRRQHWFGADRAFDVGEGADVFGGRATFEHVRVDEPAGESHPHP